MFELSVKIGGLPKIGNPFKKGVTKGSYPVTASTTDLQNFFYSIDGGRLLFGTTGANDVVKYYRECPPISYIMTRTALAFNNGIVTLHDLKKKDDDLITNTSDPLWKLYNNPNPLLRGKQFWPQVETIAKLFGVCVVLPIYTSPLLQSTPTELWILPPQYLDIKWNNKYLGARSIKDMIDSVRFGLSGNKQNFDRETIEQLYFFTDITTSLDPSPIPQSRIESIKLPILNLMELMESKNFVIRNRGAQGILANTGKDQMGATTPLDPAEESRLQNEHANKYGLSGDKWRLIITSQPLQYQNMSYSPADLMIREFYEDDLKTICNGLGYSFPLLGEGSETTFNNTEEAKKSLYQDFVIPSAQNIYDQLNDCVGAVKDGKEFRVSYDHIEVLQGDKEKEANISQKEYETAFRKFTSCAITYGRFIELCGEKNGIKAWENKYFINLSTEERELFNLSNKKQGVNNEK